MEYNLIEVQEGTTIPLLEQFNPIKNQWLLRWVTAPTEYAEVLLDAKPSLEAIKDVVLTWHNLQVDKAILCGFKWRDMPIWLNAENQLNYKATFDLVMQFQGGRGTLPVTFKFGHDGESVYHEFTSVDELADFYLSSVAYVKGVLAQGWAKKDAIDWSIYERALATYEG